MGIMECTIKGDKFIVIFEHELQPILDGMDQDYWFWRRAYGYIQLWFLSGVVLDILKRDEGRHMWS